MTNIFEAYNKCFSLTKTMRFTLIPQFNCEKILNLIEFDEEREKKYQLVKPLIDDLHRDFIERTMISYHKCKDEYKCDWNKLASAIDNIKKDNSKQNRDNIAKIQKTYQKKLEKLFKDLPDRNTLKIKTIIDEAIKAQKSEGFSWAFNGIFSKEEIDLIAYFAGFSTYFSNFEETRGNIYKSEISTSVAYRVVVDNFSKFYSNIVLFNRLDESVKQEIEASFDAKLFNVESYNSFLAQTTIDSYNTMIGEINKICNERYQDKILSHKVKFSMLFKQILTITDKQFEIETFDNKEELLCGVLAYSEFLKDKTDNDFAEFKQIFTDESINTDRIFIDNNQITQLSKILFDEWSELKKGVEKKEYYTVEQIQAACGDINIMEIVADKLECAITDIIKDKANLPKESIDDFEVMKEKIKKYLDSVQEAEKILKIFASDKTERDEVFYSYFDDYYEVLRINISLYNKVRNFATQKPYSTEKIRLYFNINNGNFLNGWVDSKTETSDNGTQYGGYLFRKKNMIGEYDYYLGISDNKRLFRYDAETITDDMSEFERYNYYQPKPQTVYGSAYKGKNTYDKDRSNLLNAIKNYIEKSNKEDLQKDFAPLFGDDDTTPTKCIEQIKIKYHDLLPDLINNEEFGSLNKLMIENIKATIKSMNRLDNTEQITERDYDLFTEIMSDVDALMKQRVFNYFPISKSELNEALNSREKPLFLFKISNKDLSYAETYSAGKRKSRGTENLHTMYFRELMSADDPSIDIGSGSVYFRKKTLDYSDDILEKGHHYSELKDKFSYPIIKDKRYAFDHFQFHLSAVFNYKYEKYKNPNDFNRAVLETLQNTHDYNIIGIDRGERNLLYVSVIDKRGNILHQESLNVINGIDYHQKLDDLENQRRKEKINWGSISRIKDLKAGYLSHAVHKITELMLKYNAVVAMEDLNSNFKRGRIHIEKQVYQNFEKALIEKLNFLVLKDRERDEFGGIRKAYQLTYSFESFQKLGKQSGFLFYVPPANTSKIDPVSGFVNLFDSRYLSYSSRVKAKEFISCFDKIVFDDETESFRFDFNYKNFDTNRSDYTNKWSIYSHGKNRIVYVNKNNASSYESVNVTDELKKLFKDNDIDYRSSTLKDDICAMNTESFFRTFLWLFRIIVQLRYGDKNDDFILSPVMVNGRFFDSRNYENVGNAAMPKDGDANGAYHIALQGLRILTQQVENGKIKNDAKGKQALNWYTFVQKKPFAE